MAARHYYELLGVSPTATADEIKRAFRQQIAKYHPDKVQHLGKELQDLAADRAAALTAGYRILSDEHRRREYDSETNPAVADAEKPPVASTEPERASAPTAEDARPAIAEQFSAERVIRDTFVLRASIGRLRDAVKAADSGYDETKASGFDVAWMPKPKVFSKKGPRLSGRFVSRVDANAVAEAWTDAGKWSSGSNEPVCVFLMGSSMAPATELAAQIADQRRKQARPGALTLIPVDARDWHAHMPLDAPEIAKSVLARLKKTT